MLVAYPQNQAFNPISQGKATGAGAVVGALAGAGLGAGLGYGAYLKNGGDDGLAPMIFGMIGVPVGALLGATVGFIRARPK